MISTLAIQRALIARGYDIGRAGADGVMGRASIAAIAKFQADNKLDIRFPGSVGPKTLAALGFASDVSAEPAWIAEARRYLGMHEARDAKTLDKALRMDASELPWCGAFVGMVVAATLPHEPLPANPLGARNWLKAGKALDSPQIGAIAVFWRGKRDGWAGHVGFCVGHDKTHLHVLGGNQADTVSVKRIAKSRLLGLRWPLTGIAAPTAPLAMSTISAAVTTNEA